MIGRWGIMHRSPWNVTQQNDPASGFRECDLLHVNKSGLVVASVGSAHDPVSSKGFVSVKCDESPKTAWSSFFGVIY